MLAANRHVYTVDHELHHAMRYFDAPQVDLKRVEYFIQRVGECEDQIFQKRARLLRRQKERRERDKQHGGRGGRGGGRGRCGCTSGFRVEF